MKTSLACCLHSPAETLCKSFLIFGSNQKARQAQRVAEQTPGSRVPYVTSQRAHTESCASEEVGFFLPVIVESQCIWYEKSEIPSYVWETLKTKGWKYIKEKVFW